MAAYIYVVLRGYFVPPFCDEINTFFTYVRTGDMQPFYAHLDANNHVINSALSRLFYVLFGGEIFILRLANMLAFAGYLYYAFRFKAFFKNSTVWLAWFIAMVTTQFIIDFFHLSRGYGLSMAFLLGAFFHLLSYNRLASTKHFLLGLTLISLAMWSNLSVLLSAICVAGVFVFTWVFKHGKKHSIADHSVQLIGLLVLFVAPAVAAILYGFELKNAGSLYYGADSDFWYYSIVRTLRFITNNWEYSNWFAAVCILILVVISIWSTLKRRKADFIQLHLVLWGSIIGIVAMHYLNDVKYPVDRAVLHLFILFSTLLFLEIDLFHKKAVRWFGFAIALSSLSLTVVNANLSHTNLWDTVHLPKAYYTKMLDWQKENNRFPTLSAHGLHKFVLDYYAFLGDDKFIPSANGDYPSCVADFVILKDDVLWEGSNLYDTVYYHPEYQSGLLQLRETPDWNVIDSVVKNQQPMTGEYMSLGDFNVANFLRNPAYISATFDAESQKELKEVQLIFSVLDSTEHRLRYEKIDLHTFYPGLRSKQTITANYLLENTPVNAAKIAVFIWNIKGKPLTISNTNTKLHVATRRP